MNCSIHRFYGMCCRHRAPSPPPRPTHSWPPSGLTPHRPPPWPSWHCIAMWPNGITWSRDGWQAVLGLYADEVYLLSALFHDTLERNECLCEVCSLVGFWPFVWSRTSVYCCIETEMTPGGFWSPARVPPSQEPVQSACEFNSANIFHSAVLYFAALEKGAK